MTAPPFLRAPCLTAVPHGFFGRTGGVSQGLYVSLNVGRGSADDPGCVAENRQRVIAAVMPTAQLVSVHQIHSATCVVVDRAWADDARPRADAMVTRQQGIIIGVLTADCAPVLFADPVAGVVGAAHAGWRGALNGVIEATVAAMVGLGASRKTIHAAVGPCIARRSYEVDTVFHAKFVAVADSHDRFFSAGRTSGKFQFDLEAFVLSQLASAGITRAEGLGADTYSQVERYFSYRRATHAGEPDYGRQISVIGLHQKP